MATTMAEAIKRLTWQFTSDGADKVAADHNKVADASDALKVKSQTTEKATLDLTKSFEGLERRFSTTIRAQQDYEKVLARLNEVAKQHPELQERVNATTERAKEHFEHAMGGASGFSKAMEIARESMIGFAIEGGPVGAILGSFGPWGIAAAAGITVLREAFEFATESSKQFGERAAEVRSFAAATGITTTEVRGLAEAGEKAGVGGDRMKVAFERLTVNLTEARAKSGELYEGLQAIDPVLADQIADARNSAEAWDLLAKSIGKTTDATLKAKTARGAFGRGGVELIPALAETNHEGGIEKYAEEVQHATGVTEELTQATAKQVKEIEALKKLAVDTFASIYAQDVLDRMKQAAELQLKIAQAARDAANSKGGPSADEFGTPFDFSLLNANKAAAGSHAPASSHGDDGHGATAEAIKGETSAQQELTKARLEDLQVVKGAANESARFNSLLGGAATGAELLEASVEKLTAAYLGNQFGAHGSAEALERFQRALHGDTSNQIASLQDQRTVIEAIGGAAKMNAQYVADYNAQVRAGRNDTDALALAQEKFNNAKAAANAGADTQLFALQNALPVAEAWTNAEKMKAQYVATYNQLVHDGVTAEKAGAVAAEQYATAKATAVASAKNLVQASEDNLDKIKAQGTGMEGVVASSIAYRDAIQAGATATQAAAIAANTLQASLAQAAQAATQALNSSQFQQLNSVDSNGILDVTRAGHSQFDPSVMPKGPLTFSAAGGGGGPNAIDVGQRAIAILQMQAQQTSGGIAGLAGSAYNTGGVDAALAAIRNAPNTLGLSAADAALYEGGGQFGSRVDAQGVLGNVRSTVDDKIAAYDQLIQLKNSQTTDKTAQANNLQSELAFIQTLPASIANAQKITSLQQSIDQLKQSTDGLNSTMGDLLSPYYTQDPRTSHIGFRSQGMASGGEVTVPGGYSANDNMYAMIPVASGEQILQVRRPGESSGGGTVINISMPMTFHGPVNKDEVGRTVYQSAQNAARRLQAASR